MNQIKFNQKGKPAITVSEEDLISNMVDYLRQHFQSQECIVYEVIHSDNETTEGAAAIFTLLKNPQLINHYNKIINR